MYATFYVISVSATRTHLTDRDRLSHHPSESQCQMTDWSGHVVICRLSPSQLLRYVVLTTPPISILTFRRDLCADSALRLRAAALKSAIEVSSTAFDGRVFNRHSRQGNIAYHNAYGSTMDIWIATRSVSRSTCRATAVSHFLHFL